MYGILIFTVLAIFLAPSDCDINVEEAFKTNGIIPDVIKEAPQSEITVRYSKANKEVKLGNILTPTQVSEIPEVQFDADSNSYYTLLLTDPDAPSRKNPIRREWHHWLVVNIPGNKISDGEVLTEYIGSAPPKNSGLHRYVFLLFKQPQKLKFDEPHHSNLDGKRGNFSTEKFAKKYNLGKPIAGNFYQAEYDESVPAVHKRLGF